MTSDHRKISLDAADRRILSALQRDSAQNLATLAEMVGLSTSACHRRVRLLEEAGVIRGYRAALDPAALGRDLTAFVTITLASQSQEALAAFERAATLAEEIQQCWLTAGDADYHLRVAAADVADFDRIHREVLARLPGVASMRSTFALRTVKPWSGYPIPR